MQEFENPAFRYQPLSAKRRRRTCRYRSKRTTISFDGIMVIPDGSGDLETLGDDAFAAALNRV
jgi:hypothetical protein